MYDMVTKKKRNQEIVRMRQAGKTFKDIASEYNISQQRVQQIYKRETSSNKIRPKAGRPRKDEIDEKRTDISTFAVTKRQRERIVQQAEKEGKPVKEVVDSIIFNTMSGKYNSLFHKKGGDNKQVPMVGNKQLLDALRAYLGAYEETPSEALRLVIDRIYGDEQLLGQDDRIGLGQDTLRIGQDERGYDTMLGTAEYDSLREYLVAVIHNQISEGERATQSLDVWKEEVDKLTVDNWRERCMNLADLLYVDTPASLADIYKDYKEELNEILRDYTDELRAGATFNKVADERLGWMWEDYDPLILEAHNQGLVARLGLLIVAEQLATQLEQGTFTIPYAN